MKMTTEPDVPDRGCDWQVRVMEDEVMVVFESDEKITVVSMSPAEAIRIAGLLESAGRYA